MYRMPPILIVPVEQDCCAPFFVGVGQSELKAWEMDVDKAFPVKSPTCTGELPTSTVALGPYLVVAVVTAFTSVLMILLPVLGSLV